MEAAMIEACARRLVGFFMSDDFLVLIADVLGAGRPGPPGHGSRSNSPPGRAGEEAVEDRLCCAAGACCSNVNSTVEPLLSRAGARFSVRRVAAEEEEEDDGADTTTGALATAALGT